MGDVFNYVRGTVGLRVQGPYPQEFVSRLASEGVDFWSLKRESELELRLSMARSDLKRAVRIAEKCSCALSVEGRRGLPFFARRMSKRPVFLAGVTLGLALCFVLTQFIWSIEVRGNEKVPAERIVRELQDMGVGIGSWGRGLEPQKLKNELLLRIPELSWFTIVVSGGRAEISVRERLETPELPPEYTASKLIAVRTGVISSAQIYSGESLVRTGQTVLQGEVLATGIIPRTLSVQLCRAQGEVYARTWHSVNGIMPLEYEKKSFTGNTEKKYAVIFGQKRVNLYLNSGISYGFYDKITEQRRLCLPGGIELPVWLVADEYREYVPRAASMTEDEAGAVLAARLAEYVGDGLYAGEILSQEQAVLVQDGMFRMTLSCECSEQIAVEIPAGEAEIAAAQPAGTQAGP